MPIQPSHIESPTVFRPDSVVSWMMTLGGAFELILSIAVFDLMSPPKPKVRGGLQIPVSALEHLRYERMLNHIYWFPSPFHDTRTLIAVACIHVLIGSLAIYAGACLRRYARKGLTLLVVCGFLFLVLGVLDGAAVMLVYAGSRFSGRYGPKFA